MRDVLVVMIFVGCFVAACVLAVLDIEQRQRKRERERTRRPMFDYSEWQPRNATKLPIDPLLVVESWTRPTYARPRTRSLDTDLADVGGVVQQTCTRCWGLGIIDGADCNLCDGTGLQMHNAAEQLIAQRSLTTCAKCNGSGLIESTANRELRLFDVCDVCKGGGVIDLEAAWYE